MISNEEITKDVVLGGNRHKDQVFFKFYIYLMDLCSSMQLGGFQLKDYFNLPERIKDLYVKGSIVFQHRETGKKVRLKYTFLKEVYDYCDDSQKSNYVDIYKRAMGSFMYTFMYEDEKKYSTIVAYLFNPQNYPGMHEAGDAIRVDNGIIVFDKNVILPFQEYVINDKLIYIPWCYVTDEVFEIIE